MAQYGLDHLKYDGSADTWEIIDAKNRGNIAPAYSASSTYAVGDMVLYNGQLYECNTAIATAEAWTAAHWTAVTVGAEIATVKDGLQAVNNTVDTYLLVPEDTKIQLTSTAGVIRASGVIDYASYSNLVHYNVPVNEGEKYTITTYSQGNTVYPFCVFWDENDSAVDTVASGDNAVVTKSVVVPANAVSMSINNNTNTAANPATVILNSYRKAKDVSKNVDVLNSEVTSIANATVSDLLVGVTWEVGSINPDTGADLSSTQRIRTAEYIDISNTDYITLTVASGYKFVIDYFDASKNAVADTDRGSWQTGTKTYYPLPVVKYVRFLLATSNDSAVGTDIASNFSASFFTKIANVYNDTEFLKSLEIKPDYFKAEKATYAIAPATFAVQLKSGHVYQARFKSDTALNQSSFYLQIWQTQNVSGTGTLLKNFGNVWYTLDTSKGLEYTFVPSQDYSGWMRYGFDTSVATNINVTYELYDLTVPFTPDSYWKGKKIVWFGTSIPAGVQNAGQSGGNGAYPTRVGQMLGATVYNESIGSSAVRAGNHNYITESDPMGYAGLYQSSLMLSLSLSSEEKQEIIDDWNIWKDIVPAPSSGQISMDATAQAQYLASSWDNLLAKYLTGGSVGQVDLYVFDVGYNDSGYNYNWTDLSADPPSEDTSDRTYFLGAMRFILLKILNDNPHARICFIGHLENNLHPQVAQAQEKLAGEWDFALCKTWEKLGWTQETVTVNGESKTMLQVWCPDGIHPSSDTTGQALQKYAEVLFPFIRDVR